MDLEGAITEIFELKEQVDRLTQQMKELEKILLERMAN